MSAILTPVEHVPNENEMLTRTLKGRLDLVEYALSVSLRRAKPIQNCDVSELLIATLFSSADRLLDVSNRVVWDHRDRWSGWCGSDHQYPN
nr:hypothetical protein NG677_23660 [Methylobacterium sp.]